MERAVDLMSTNGTAEWTKDAGVTLELCQWPDLISGDLPAALMARFAAGTAGLRFGKVLAAPVSLTDVNELVLTVTSLRAPTGPIWRASSARYALDLVDSLGATRRFYIPCFKAAGQVEVPTAGMASVAAFWIYKLDQVEDQAVFSNLLAVREEMPKDLLAAVKRGVEARRDFLLGYGVEIGTATFAAGASKVTINTDWSWVERYAVLRFRGAGVDEVHQADNAVSNEVTFTNMYGGKRTLNAATAAKVYVTMPVEIGNADREVLLPGVCVWYSGPDPDPRTSRASEEVKCVGPSGIASKRDGLLSAWTVTMDNEARSPELIALITGAIRAFMARSTVWVHGKKFWFEWSDPAVPVEPVEGYDVIPNTAYSIKVSVREESWAGITGHASHPADLDVAVQ